MILPRDFYDRPVLEVARELLGKRLIRVIDGQRMSAYIIEVEAYDGEADQACHARSGMTRRNAPLYGSPGFSYVYLTYGMHWLMNCVTGSEGYPAAVLLRGLLPIEGLERIARNRGKQPPKHWCDGPGKLSQALEIGKAQNQINLCSKDGGLYLEEGIAVPETIVNRSPRIGINYAPEPWRSLPWRLWVDSDALPLNGGSE